MDETAEPQRTLALIKFDCLVRGQFGKVLDAVIADGFTVVATDDCSEAAKFRQIYAEHEGKPYYDGLMRSVQLGSLAVILERVDAIAWWRTLMGPTDPEKARKEAPKSLRALYGTKLPDNAVHGSDSPESAAREIAIFFGAKMVSPIRARLPYVVEQTSLSVLQPVQSSNIVAMGHDATTREFFVKWTGSGKISVYADVPADVAAKVLEGNSPGTAVRSILVPTYKHHYLTGGVGGFSGG